ncbi:hypothetical protein ASG40_15990 [Methylobacterium sp. Leaf399]|uniref:hypothetical protein n=1 Tax=unclassified Methylobacterium TaxID=2615210 RepID=UPI0007010F9D|nr:MULTISPECIES: hypothetical protein [unclassified Methylobacterium]KQT18837.1 hypothetical protein ASG40_15990 [Methylobacterium sp. Leaf399]KQT86915.1 hypothetical protein ASG59_16965 [Methylobacterium sp. Leaf466]
MLIVENPHASTTLPDDLLTSEDAFNAVKSLTAVPYTVPFEVLGEPIVPGLTQVPLVLQGTFIQITNTATSGSASIQLSYRPTVPFILSASGGTINLAANLVYYDLTIYDQTFAFTKSPSNPNLFYTIPANQTLIVGVQYVSTGLSLASRSGAVTESAGNRGIVSLLPSGGSTFLATATVRQFFVNQNAPLAPIAAAAYSVPIGGGGVIVG